MEIDKIKREIKFLVEELPENATHNDVERLVKRILHWQDIISGKKDFSSEKTYTMEEVKEMLEKKLGIKL